MKPEHYTVKNGKTIFHYSFSKLKEFIKHGLKEGNNGLIVIENDNDMMKYKGFGTIENPSKKMRTFTKKRLSVFDGEFNADEIITPTPIFTEKDIRFKMLDLSKTKN